jgi:hypothetical protein
VLAGRYIALGELVLRNWVAANIIMRVAGGSIGLHIWEKVETALGRDIVLGLLVVE